MTKPTIMAFLSKLIILSGVIFGALTQHHEGVQCSSPFRPLLSNADFNADGIVDNADVAELAQNLQNPRFDEYYALYDLNADRSVDSRDLVNAAQSIGDVSTNLDREAARTFQMAKHLRGDKSELEWRSLGYVPINVPLAGHGVHYFSPSGVNAVTGRGAVNFSEVQGLNIGDSGNLDALFWGAPALPLYFVDGQVTPLDYQTCQPYNGDLGCQWINYPAIAFYTQEGVAPPVITENSCESWHAHAGLCLYELEDGTVKLDQHLTFLECVTTPSKANPAWALPPWNLPPRLYLNFWMVHYWNYNPNPAGLFANTHPCVTPDGVSEESLNDRSVNEYGREIPHFFKALHHQTPTGECGPIMQGH